MVRNGFRSSTVCSGFFCSQSQSPWLQTFLYLFARRELDLHCSELYRMFTRTRVEAWFDFRWFPFTRTQISAWRGFWRNPDCAACPRAAFVRLRRLMAKAPGLYRVFSQHSLASLTFNHVFFPFQASPPTKKGRLTGAAKLAGAFLGSVTASKGHSKHTIVQYACEGRGYRNEATKGQSNFKSNR